MNSAPSKSNASSQPKTDDLVRFVKRGLFDSAQVSEIPDKLEKAHRVYAICQKIELDDEALCGAFLVNFAPFTAAQFDKIKTAYGEVVCEMIKGVQQMSSISAFSKSSQGTISDENLRKMLIAMVNDVRVVLIKLADQVDILRNLKDAPEQIKRDTAQLTLDVYARLANRLGVWYLKWEMEDYALRYLEPRDYHQVAQELAEKRVDREQYIENFIASIHKKLVSAGIKAKIYGRPKHIYSIWRKMKLKGLAFNNILDIRAVRILVENIENCYAALGLVHTSWPHLQGEFDDYIATPKANGYQSIHTAVIASEDRVVEVQIRTFEMHEENELGVAAHWRYKEGSAKGGKDHAIDNKIQWLRQLLEWKEDLGADEGLAAQFDSEAEAARIYVFTPKGRVIDLPQGATAIDFAYSIHTEVGHRTRGARINQIMRPLNTPLETGDQVEIITVKTGSPSRDWIAIPGFIQTHRARTSVAHWFKSNDRDLHLSLGREKLERALSQKRLHDLSFDKISAAHDYDSSDEMMIALGLGDAKAGKLLGPFLAHAAPKKQAVVAKHKPPESKQQIKVHGVGNLKTQIANCCKPMPGENIVGYITRGRGITIHLQNCSNMQALAEEDLNRLIDVTWGMVDDAVFVLSISVLAYNRSNMLHDVTHALKEESVSIIKAVLDIQEDESVVIIYFDLELSGQQSSEKIMNQVRNIPNVLEVKRIVSA